VIPLFYRADEGDIPHRWVSRMKDSISELVPRFAARRMAKEYCEDYYLPAMERYSRLCENDYGAVRELDEWKHQLERHWHEVAIQKVSGDGDGRLEPGREIHVAATVKLGSLSISDVEAQICVGPRQRDQSILVEDTVTMEPKVNGDLAEFRGTIRLADSGNFGYTVRIIPSHPLLGNPLRLGLVKWAQS